MFGNVSGYGTGLENVMAGAGTTARAEYGQEYAADVAGAMATFRGQLNRRSQEYDVASRNWLMGRENEYWKQRQDYESDPYADFEAFYRGGGGSSRTGGGTVLSEIQRTRPQRDKEWNERPFTRARSTEPATGAGVGWDKKTVLNRLN